MTLELEKVLSPTAYERLRSEAERQNEPLITLVREVLESYVNALDQADGEDTPDSEILAKFEEGWRDIRAGRTTPSDEAIAELLAQRAARLAKHGRD